MAFAGSIIVGSPPIIISQHSYYAPRAVLCYLLYKQVFISV